MIRTKISSKMNRIW